MKIYPEFKLVSNYNDENLLPVRATDGSAGYDFVVAEDIVVPSYLNLVDIMNKRLPIHPSNTDGTVNIDQVADFTKKYQCKPTLVPTGVKAYIPEGKYLQLSVRSSCPLKNWLILANGVGIIDSDYFDNPDNEGHIYFQIINLFPQDIKLHKGDKIGQGVFLDYHRTVDDHNLERQRDKRSGGFGSTTK